MDISEFERPNLGLASPCSQLPIVNDSSYRDSAGLVGFRKSWVSPSKVLRQSPKSVTKEERDF